MAGKTKWALGLTGLLTAYMFLYTTSLWLAGRDGAQALSPGQQELFYDLRQLLAAAGFLSFGLLGRLAREDRGRRVLAGFFLAGYGAGMVPLLAGADAGLTQAFSGAAVFCLGGLGGLVYWKMALSLAGSGVMGLVMGLACGAAYGLQFLCQLGEGTALLPAALAAAWGVVAVLLMRRPRPEAREEAQGAAPEKTGRTALVSAVVITLGLLVLDMLLDSQLARLQSAAGAAISQLPRLLLIPGSLLFGLAADRKQGRYLPLAVLCAMLVTLLIPTLLGSAESFQLNQCLFYVGVAATLSYYNLTFWRLAPGTARPELWASMGRVLDGALGGLLGLAHFSGLPAGAVLVIDLAGLGVVILTSLGTWGLPQMVQKFYAIKSEDAVQKGTVISTLFAFVVAGGCYFLGGFGRLFSDQIDIAANGFDSIIPTMLSGLSAGMIAMIVILVLSASMSTLSSLVIASSSTLAIDLIKDNFAPNMSEAKQVLLMRVLIVVFIAISAVLALIQYKSSVNFIAQMMGISWGAMAGAFLAPFMYSLYSKKITTVSCWICFGFSVPLMIANMFVRPLFPPIMQSPINAGAIAMIAGMLIVPIVSALTEPPEQKLVDEAFRCYEKETTVPQYVALGKK